METCCKRGLLQAGLDIETSAICYYRQWFGLDEQSQAKVLNFINKQKQAVVPG